MEEPGAQHRQRQISEKEEDNSSGDLPVGSFDSFVEGYELIQPPVADLIPRPKILRSEPLGEAEWLAYFDSEGRIANYAEIKRKIFSGVCYQLKFRWIQVEIFYNLGFVFRALSLPFEMMSGNIYWDIILGPWHTQNAKSTATDKWKSREISLKNNCLKRV